jgi:hypothetical protein
LRASINAANIGVAATPDSHPDCRAPLTKIVALQPSQQKPFGDRIQAESRLEKAGKSQSKSAAKATRNETDPRNWAAQRDV